ncbi:ABC transporter ATP-binding protein [Halogeometricum borinquense]|uniref:Nickel import system ATP-binding protein NikD n=1 Tax=Halogeometricum borinquense TaxID=60847 RepID=A0A482T6F8_9EURY|nr:ABC transporter ATP-binding protein [Halogeometricum borinquense]RYJ08205.1 ABC transporter ATP-binding protein [Halogeometricum borinquense]
MAVVRQSLPDQSLEPVLSVDNLSVEYLTEDVSVKAVRDVSLHINAGETLGIAGESGSGKSTLALSILRYLGENGRITSGNIEYHGASILDLSSKELRALRGNEIAHVPQDPNTSLNPSMRVGDQIAEVLRTHRDISRAEAMEQTYDVLREVNIPDPERNAKQYPHELSGGQQQRVLLAIALACQPQLLILDEPTTGLDVTTQAKILDLINELIEERNTSVLLITHNLGVISRIADRVGIMYAGEILEYGSTEKIFESPANPYTQGLLASLPQGDNQRLKPIPGQIGDLTAVSDGCTFANRCEFAEPACRSGSIQMEAVRGESDHLTQCRRWEHALTNPIQADTQERHTSPNANEEPLIEVRNVRKHFDEPSMVDRFLGGEPPVKAVDGVSFDIHDSETLAVVGESGCGKSTLGSVLLDLQSRTDGSVSYKGTDVGEMNSQAMKEFRSECQIVFQNPHSSLNPKHTVGEAIKRPLEMFTDLSDAAQRERVAELLTQVGLQPDYAKRYPRDLSGGEKQRVAIARAFSVNPSFVVLDEPVSALDVSVQASILNLLTELREAYGTSYLLISHDLSVVRYISDRVAVMYLGNIAEIGTTEEIFEPPYHPYTRALLSSIPSTDPTVETDRIYLDGDVPSARDPPSGCPFHTRCPQKIGDVCERDVPSLEATESAQRTHQIACHLEQDEMVPDEAVSWME